jgi:hypothetical protein
MEYPATGTSNEYLSVVKTDTDYFQIRNRVYNNFFSNVKEIFLCSVLCLFSTPEKCLTAHSSDSITESRNCGQVDAENMANRVTVLESTSQKSTIN